MELLVFGLILLVIGVQLYRIHCEEYDDHHHDDDD